MQFFGGLKLKTSNHNIVVHEENRSTVLCIFTVSIARNELFTYISKHCTDFTSPAFNNINILLRLINSFR